VESLNSNPNQYDGFNWITLAGDQLAPTFHALLDRVVLIVNQELYAVSSLAIPIINDKKRYKARIFSTADE